MRLNNIDHAFAGIPLKAMPHLFIALVVVVFLAAGGPALAQIDMKTRPVLVITNDPMPAAAPSPLYTRPVRAPDITAAQVSGPTYFEPTQTVVGRKIEAIRTDLFALQSRLSGLSDKLKSIDERGRGQSAEYNASIATINTQLQSGTTPGNPRLVQKLDVAQDNLDRLSESVADLNALAVDVANAASVASFLIESTRSAYGLSGAIEEDHARLAQMEDQINSAVVSIDRLLTDVNDDITRTSAFVSSERGNLRTLALGVTTGDMYGKSLANKTFSGAGLQAAGLMQPASYPAAAVQATPLSSPRQLAKIRFDRPDVNFEQPVYLAVNQAMEKYPQARFDVVAVHPSNGNAAQVAIESTRARRNAERVMRSLAQMGLSLDRVDLSHTASPDVQTSEVHIFLR